MPLSPDRAFELDWHASEPFSNGHELEDAGRAQLYGDLTAAGRLRAAERHRKHREQALKEIDPRRLSADDLRAMRTWDKERYFEPDGCEAYGCDEDEHDDACPLSSHCDEELELHGLALHRRDPKFWVRLRKLGATPEIVAEANAILHPKRNGSQPRMRPRQPMCAARRHRGARPRGRRSAPARRVVSRSAGGGSSGDPHPDEPGEARHQHHRAEDSQLAGALA